MPLIFTLVQQIETGTVPGKPETYDNLVLSLSLSHPHTYVPEGRGELEETVSSVVIFMEAIRSVQRLLQRRRHGGNSGQQGWEMK